ncbi:gluconokinase [Mytilus galloprovincialis]|uniref:gluconokinase n=1 Tax=Mytilus galloprovincialis TaxID=29158 RepID=A0A8B6CAS8_MYTGA|nr:gluconokinase [Mytilus galloprovincialis]
MGVCGSGKTVVGEALANELNIVFRDADEFHSVENKNKMAQSIPLTDEGSQECIQKRLEKRTGHFMPPALLKSQFSTLEEPTADESFCATVEIDEKSVSEIVKNILGIL